MKKSTLLNYLSTLEHVSYDKKSQHFTLKDANFYYNIVTYADCCFLEIYHSGIYGEHNNYLKTSLTEEETTALISKIYHKIPQVNQTKIIENQIMYIELAHHFLKTYDFDSYKPNIEALKSQNKLNELVFSFEHNSQQNECWIGRITGSLAKPEYNMTSLLQIPFYFNRGSNDCFPYLINIPTCIHEQYPILNEFILPAFSYSNFDYTMNNLKDTFPGGEYFYDIRTKEELLFKLDEELPVNNTEHKRLKL